MLSAACSTYATAVCPAPSEGLRQPACEAAPPVGPAVVCTGLLCATLILGLSRSGTGLLSLLKFHCLSVLPIAPAEVGREGAVGGEESTKVR